MTSEEVISGLAKQGVAISHCRQLKRTVTNEVNLRIATPLPIRVITVSKSTENLAILKQVRGIHHFTIKIQDFRSQDDRSMQCFRCQDFGHKAEFCNLKDRCVKCDGSHNTRACVKLADAPPQMYKLRW